MGNSVSKSKKKTSISNKNSLDTIPSKQNDNINDIKSIDNTKHLNKQEDKKRCVQIVQQYVADIQEILNTYIIPESIVVLCFNYYYCIGFRLDYNLSVNNFTCLSILTKNNATMKVSKNDNGKIYAMRVQKINHMLERKQIIHVQTERLVLSDIDHPFIISLRFAFQNEHKLYLVTDFMYGTELFFYLKNEGRFTHKRSKFYSAEICLALKYLHSQDIIYGDLRPENIFLDNGGHIKLTDFNFCKEALSGDIITHVFNGITDYLAPEILQQQCISKGVDWWAFGILLYEMMTGLPPFYNENINVMREKILYAPIPLPRYLHLQARSIFLGLLDRDLKHRLGCSNTDALEIEQHPFYMEIDWDKCYKKELEPPFKPRVKDAYDGGERCIDEEFIEESIIMSHELLLAKDVFEAFTFEAQ
eukprot:396060_1